MYLLVYKNLNLFTVFIAERYNTTIMGLSSGRPRGPRKSSAPPSLPRRGPAGGHDSFPASKSLGSAPQKAFTP